MKLMKMINKLIKILNEKGDIDCTVEMKMPGLPETTGSYIIKKIKVESQLVGIQPDPESTDKNIMKVKTKDIVTIKNYE